MMVSIPASIRTDIKTYGAPQKSAGGNAVNHYMDVRITLRRTNDKDRQAYQHTESGLLYATPSGQNTSIEKVGYEVDGMIVKSKVSDVAPMVRQDKKENAVEDEQEASDNKYVAAMKNDNVALPATAGNMNSENLKSLIKLQMQHTAIESRYLDNQNRLLDIIAAQQNQIANLTRQLNRYELLKAKEYGSDMVSDELNK